MPPGIAGVLLKVLHSGVLDDPQPEDEVTHTIPVKNPGSAATVNVGEP